MKISLERDQLLSQLQTVSRVASTRSAIQALSGVQVVVSSTNAELRATDMDVSLRVPLAAERIREGIVVLPARLLLDVVRALPAPEVTLELRPPNRTSSSCRATQRSTFGRCARKTFRRFPRRTQNMPCRSRGGVRIDGDQGRRVGVEGRNAPRSDRDPRFGVGPGAPDGRDRLLPAERQGDPTRRGAASPIEVNVPARALQELARIAAAAGEIS